jgi:hypothetical protein
LKGNYLSKVDQQEEMHTILLQVKQHAGTAFAARMIS